MKVVLTIDTDEKFTNTADLCSLGIMACELVFDGACFEDVGHLPIDLAVHEPYYDGSKRQCTAEITLKVER